MVIRCEGDAWGGAGGGLLTSLVSAVLSYWSREKLEQTPWLKETEIKLTRLAHDMPLF